MASDAGHIKNCLFYVLAGVTRMLRDEFSVLVKQTTYEDFNDALRDLPPEKREKSLMFWRMSEFDINHSGGYTTSEGIRQNALMVDGIIGRQLEKRLAVSSLATRQSMLSPDQQLLEETEGNVKTHRRYRVKPLAVNIGLELAFFSDDIDELQNFFIRWCYAAENATLWFKLNYLGIVLPISVIPGDAMSVPQHSSGPNDAARYMSYTGDLTVGGFVTLDDPRYLREQPILNYIELDTQIM